MSSNKTNWYLRKPDGSEYGPISTSDLQRWAAQCRVVAGNGVSSDREEWIKVEDIPELEMDWIAHRPDGSEYGPFNISATQELIDHKVLTEDATLTHKTTKKSVTVEQVLNEEDLFSDSEQQEQDESEDQALSEEALKEEALYAEMQQTETESTTPDANLEQSKTNPEPQQPSTELEQQIDKLQDKLQKAKVDLNQARDDLKSAQQEMAQTVKELSEQHKQAQQKTTSTIKTLTEERDQAQAELTPLQNRLENAAKKQIKNDEANIIHCEDLKAKLEEAQHACQQAESKLAQLESERSQAESKSLHSVTELRKQTAFMKKNSATLQHELEKLQIISNRRGRQLISMITGISIIAGIMLLMGKPSCRKAEKDMPQADPQTSSEIAEKTPLSQRPYSADTPIEQNETPTQSPHVPRPTLNTPQPSATWPKFTIEGVKAIESSKTCSLRFDSGVFTSLTTPSSGAIKQMQEISEILRPQMSSFRIIVEGCTDNTPMRPTATYNGNHALGLARAETIKKLLINKGRLPNNSITARYAGENKAPYPNDTASNRKRNRTVVLKIVRK